MLGFFQELLDTDGSTGGGGGGPKKLSSAATVGGRRSLGVWARVGRLTSVPAGARNWATLAGGG